MPRFLTWERRDPGARVLQVTNMWPVEAVPPGPAGSPGPRYGIFVKRQVDSLIEAGVQCDVLLVRGFESRLALVNDAPFEHQRDALWPAIVRRVTSVPVRTMWAQIWPLGLAAIAMALAIQPQEHSMGISLALLAAERSLYVAAIFALLAPATLREVWAETHTLLRRGSVG